MLLVAIVLGAVLGRSAFADLHPTLLGALLGLLASVPLLGAVALGARSDWRPVARIGAQIRDDVAPLFADCTIGDLAIIAVLAGLCEEILFRGVLQTALVGLVGVVGAILLTNVVFGIAHMLSIAYAVYAAVIGIVMGVLLLVTGNVFVPVVAHATFDFVALAYLIHLRPGEQSHSD